MRNRLGRLAAGLAAMAGGLTIGADVLAAAPPPVVPGFNRLKDDAKAPAAQLGQVLLGELNCAQCHAAAPNAKRILTKGAPDLSDAGARLTPHYLRQYLLAPHAVKPGTTMPDLFHASDEHAKQGAVDFLVEYLISRGGPIKPASEEGGKALVEAGRKLYQTVGCVACHAPEPSAAGTGTSSKVPSVPLPSLAEKTTVDQLEAFLLNPLKERPASRMPNIGLSEEEAHALAVYLLRDQMTNPQLTSAQPMKVHGVEYEYYAQSVPNASVRTIGRLKPAAKGKLDGFTLNFPGQKDEEFAVKFTATLVAPHDGTYTFYTTSDDGSRLYLDARPIVNNDGDHSPAEKEGKVKLTAGDHPIVVTYYQRGGGKELKVEWAGPGFERQEISTKALTRAAGAPMVPLHSEPFTGDEQKAQMGARMFTMIGCASCHALPDVKSERPAAKALDNLNIDNDTGCLGAHVAKGLPNYDLDDEQRQALKAAIADQAGLGKPFRPSEQVIHTMAAMNCFACHNRDNVGGPPADRNDYFTMTSAFDMGEEGRIPPRLTHAGQKLFPPAMEQIIFEGKLHVRPVLATRMPIWGKQALGTIVDAFQQADQTAEPPPPAFSEQSIRDGHQLVGVRGLGCVNCHGINGTNSLGMPAPDLGTVHDRIKLGWFHQWLDNPPSLVPGTRMPQFWPGHEAPFKDIAGGTEEGQIAAIWSYMSLGRLMPLPAGLVPTNAFELSPTDVPIVHRTFMAGVGPRAILVGFPEMVHVAFDANGVRLAKAWRGKFFDARGMWQGRGGQALGPLGAEIIDMPAGPAFAILEHPDSPWPKIQEPVVDDKYRNVGGRFKGYELDKQERPTFHYILHDVDVYEQPAPVYKTMRAQLDRRFTLKAAQPPSGLCFLAAAGDKIEPKSSGTWLIDGKLTIALRSSAKLSPALRDAGGHKQLLVPIPFINGTASFDMEMSW